MLVVLQLPLAWAISTRAGQRIPAPLMMYYALLAMQSPSTKWTLCTPWSFHLTDSQVECPHFDLAQDVHRDMLGHQRNGTAHPLPPPRRPPTADPPPGGPIPVSVPPITQVRSISAVDEVTTMSSVCGRPYSAVYAIMVTQCLSHPRTDVHFSPQESRKRKMDANAGNNTPLSFGFGCQRSGTGSNRTCADPAPILC
jgi:hypothetical protein